MVLIKISGWAEKNHHPNQQFFEHLFMINIHPCSGRKTANNHPSHTRAHVSCRHTTNHIWHSPRTKNRPRHILAISFNNCFTFQLMEDNVPMPSLDTVSISKPFYKSWTSQAEVNQHHSLLAHLISLLFFCRVNTIRWRYLVNPGNLQGSSPASGVKMLSLTRHLPWMSIRIIATECGSWCSPLKVKYFAR